MEVRSECDHKVRRPKGRWTESEAATLCHPRGRREKASSKEAECHSEGRSRCSLAKEEMDRIQFEEETVPQKAASNGVEAAEYSIEPELVQRVRCEPKEEGGRSTEGSAVGIRALSSSM